MADGCRHRAFAVNAEVNRIEEEERPGETLFKLELRVHCEECGEAFVFFGLPAGESLANPTMRPGGIEASLPLRPASEVNRALPRLAGEGPRAMLIPWSQRPNVRREF